MNLSLTAETAWALPSLSEADMLPCLSKQLLGMDCPGCGLQRSVALLLRGEFWESFLMYPGLFPMLCLFGFMAADRILPIPQANKITIALALLTVGAILTNFTINLLT